MQKLYLANTLADLRPIARQLLTDFADQRIFAFKADMGVGKTTFIKAICEELEVEDAVTSPTFAIANTYLSKSGSDLYHFDFYRLDKATDAYDIGFEEYLDSGNYCFIEWVEKVESLLPPHYVIVEMEEQATGARQIIAKKN
ncbi:MAG: tRNA (adenosine(37)-N6)-threonylcarbamoyltransferase complex ATPase subunit type 1 TsaE [Bacteroidales bacterium]|jgi:tRNA threonylcarbamoyladenosine biosynthesis protein TsaE|nr:tRNA (adenosine(37)-N6)-threonylcarbamoyltransferase complex ATPase subunit type 1 TsaE [Bacteroidales bacterium]